MWIVICYLGQKISRPEQIVLFLQLKDQKIWNEFSEIFNFKNTKLLQYQVKVLVNSRGVSKKWEKQEETILLSILSQNNYLLTPNGKNIKWNEASLKLYFSSNRIYFRHPKQIREHWINHLDPQITKQNWTLQQDTNLIKYVIEKGKKWALIAKTQGRRTQHMIKNRFRALIRKQQNCFSNVANEMQLLHLIKYKYELCKFGQASCTKMLSIDSKLESFEEQVFEKQFEFLSNNMKIIENPCQFQEVSMEQWKQVELQFNEPFIQSQSLHNFQSFFV